MHIRFICECDVDGAAEKLLGYIQEMVEQRVIYFHGWSGLGASAVLRSIADLLPSRRGISELCFDRIIFIDCSEWKSRRAMQRAIAEELKLDSLTMAIIDKEDENDDFYGIVESSRGEIISVSRKIYHTLKDSRFIMLFCNGSDDEIDLYGSGVPSFGKFADNILIWISRRRVMAIKDYEKHELLQKLRLTHVLSYHRAQYLTDEQFYAVLCEEAVIIAPDIDPTTVADCFLYNLFLDASFRTTTKYYWASHAAICWICDRMLHEDIETETSNSLHREISLECDASLLPGVLANFKKHSKIPFLRVEDDDVYEVGPYRWISITSKQTQLHGIQIIPAQTSSFILEFDISEPPLALTNSLFEHSNILGVLILCSCDFNFASPPFIKCHSLKFLGLEKCTDNKMCEVEDHTEWECLYRLRVLDLCSTYWDEILSEEKIDMMTNIRELNIEGFMCWQYTTRLQGRLPNLERLRITEPTRDPEISADTSNSFLGKAKLEILDLSGNSDMEILPSSLSEVSSLEVLVLNGCTKLQDIVPDVLPRFLRSFRLDSYGSSSRQTPTVEQQPMERMSPSSEPDKKGVDNIYKISLRGCTHLDNLHLRGLPNLVELDLSGSAIKVLDFETMVVEVPRLKRIFLLGCEHLRAIRWGRRHANLELLCIDTRAGTMRPWPSLSQNKPFKLQVHVVVEDARFAWSLWSPIKSRIMYTDVYFNIRVTSSPVHNGSVQLEAISKEKHVMFRDTVSVQLWSVPASPYIDVLCMVSDAPPMQAFPDPPATYLDRHIEIAKGSCGLERALDGKSPSENLAHIIRWCAESLHVHDVSVSASMPVGDWDSLKQCRMERCPKFDIVFPSQTSKFHTLETLWVLDLLMVRQIWSKGHNTNYHKFFQNLQHLHLSSCPRLQFVLPVSMLICFVPSLETLHIVHCGDIKHIFVLDGRCPEQIAFPKLTTIHLYDLPMLRQMCEVKTVAPQLESIKIRGCFGLRRLPVVDARGPGVKKPTVEIEKDVWDALEWDGVEAGHHPSHFEAPVHSRYYKKKLPRTSVLR